MASNLPVLAPEGTIARPLEPSSRPTSHSRVGFPRESRTSRARTSSIAAMGKVSRWSWGRGGRKRAAASISSAPHSFGDFHREMREAWRSGGLGVVVRVLGGLVTCPEPPGGAAKGRLRLDTALAGERDHREQQVPHPALEPLRALGFHDLLERLADLGGRTVPVRPGEAGVAHALLELGGELQRRQGRGDAGQRIGAALLLPLDRLPIAQHLAGGADLDVAEHVRVPADQLLGDGARDPVDVELPGVLGDLGVEHHLQEQVAQLLAQVVGTGRARALLLDRVEDLVDLLHQVAGEARVGLLGVPGAAARSETICTSGPSLIGGSSRVAEPRSFARPSSASACRRAVATWSASMPWPSSSRSRPTGPVSSATGRTSKGISPTSSAGSEGWSTAST